jgi:transposase-like protein
LEIAMTNLTDKIFTDPEAARQHFESIRWPSGEPSCPHCGTIGETTLVKGKSHRPGLYQCNACREPFTVTVGTVMEKSHIPLNKWALGFHLMASSKKGISAHQLHRTLGITYKSAWFLAHRIREALIPVNPSPMGGEGKTVESDETYIGRKEDRKLKRGTGHKMAALSLVERGGKVRSFKVDNVTRETVQRVLHKNVSPDSHLMTDEAPHYGQGVGIEKHERINHSADEYARGDVSTNTIEGFFSIFKRGMHGVYQYCGEQHLHRYLSEFDFRYSHREKTGYSDSARTVRAIMGAEGRRLTYRQVAG